MKDSVVHIQVERLRCTFKQKDNVMHIQVEGHFHKESYNKYIIGPINGRIVLTTFKIVTNAKDMPTLHLPAKQMIVIIPWPVQKYGLDIVGSLPISSHQKKLFIMDINSFSKWIEDKPLEIIQESEVHKFIWCNIIFRFCLPYELEINYG